VTRLNTALQCGSILWRFIVDWKTTEWAPTAVLVIALLMLLALLKGIRGDRKARRAEKVDYCIRNHFAGQPQGQKHPLEDVFENLATAREIVNRQMKRPSLKEVKESLKRLTKAGLLETDGIRWGRPRISLQRRL
jgi:hypothetical protein